jgi:radical SAM superfamily enzyme YgiQ (UPF0313 family)
MVSGRELFPPLGAMKVAAIPDREGHQVKIIDGNITETKKAKETINRSDPDFVGFTTFTGPALRNALELSNYTKENTEAKVIWGGVHSTLLPHQVIEEKDVDIVVRGEGDLAIYDILESRGHLDKIKGILYKDENGKIVDNGSYNLISDLGSLPPTPWHLIDAKKYIVPWADAKGTLAIITSRGCPCLCAFCYNTEFNMRQWRPFPLEYVKNEIDFLRDNFPIDGVRILADSFIGRDLPLAREITRYLKKQELKWSCLIRVNEASRETLEGFKEDGCNYILYGVESGSQKMLDFMKKGVTVKQIKNAVELSNELGIRHALSVIFDIPTENSEDVKKTFKLIKELGSYVSVFAYQPYPGTEMYQYCIDNGLIDLPKGAKGWATFKYDEAHGLSNWSREKYSEELENSPEKFQQLVRKEGARIYNRYNYFMNIKFALTKGDFPMLYSMGKHFVISSVKMFNQR